MTHFNNDWDELLKEETKKEYMTNLRTFLNNEYKKHTVYPKKSELLAALALTPYKDTKVVILGQDPYHQPNQAHGLAFSIKDGQPLPPSLQNIYKEIEKSTGKPCPKSGNLTYLATQGVLLLNTVLSVVKSNPGSHRQKGWEQFTDYIISLLNERNDPIVFMLWGADAKKKIPLITNSNHLILTAAHPSPLSAYNGFFGCDHFNKANDFLTKTGNTPIKWS